MLQYFKPENYALIRSALMKAGRRDLIGSGPHCLVPAAPNTPQQSGGRKQNPQQSRNAGKKPVQQNPHGRQSGKPSQKPRGKRR